MSDLLGRVVVPGLPDSGLTFPFTTDFGYGYTDDKPIIVHRFGSLDAKAEQRFQVGIGPKKHSFRRANLSVRDRNTLAAFWESLQGPWKTFTYKVPNVDQTFTSTQVTWENAPLSLNYLLHAASAGINFIEVPTSTPSYSINSTTGITSMSTVLQTALLDQVQKIIPMVHIRVSEAAVPDIYLSDRRCVIGGNLYLPRLLDMGTPGGSALITQSLNGASDDATFVFGNADRVMTWLSNDTDLKFATLEFCLYHVNTATKINVWTGFVQDYSSNGSSKFTVKASDGLYQVTQMYPTRTVSRQCWKTFNDGINCPFSTKGNTNPAACDYYFDSAEGCVAHGMQAYFGGVTATPEGVNIKDNSTGLWGIDRNTVTATSIVSDSIWGNALPDIWCNSFGDPTKAFIVNGMIASGRDESDFYTALVIVGAGQIGRYSPMTVAQNADGFRYIVAPLLDGQPPHGFKVDGNMQIQGNSNFAYGLREIGGSDPTGDGFSLTSQLGLTYGAAAGVAFIEIKRTDTKGIQPSSPDSHSCTIPIDEGLTGFTWDANGNRSAVPGLINPFWIAANTYLRCLGLYNADSATQLSKLNVSSLFKGDGTGAAEIAAFGVQALIGTGLEVQFAFQGILAQQKPCRDWLTEILNCACGYFYWDFGKLSFGCRENASAVDTYTLGNTLFQSLEQSPIEAAFEHLIIDFANQAYQYQTDTAEYTDRSHAAYYGRSGSPLVSRMHSLGISTLSQGCRVAAVRTREELGGVNPTEWRNARYVNWKTTLLGLNNHVGQVVSQTAPDLPGKRGTANISGTTVTIISGDDFSYGDDVNKTLLINNVKQVLILNVNGNVLTVDNPPGDVTGASVRVITMDLRIQSWSLNKDWSVSITGKTVTRSMYDLLVGPKPLDTAPRPLPQALYPVPLGPAWAPYQVQAASFDVLFPNEYNFDVDQDYVPMGDGSTNASLLITGKLPVNAFNQYDGKPVIGNVTVNTTGGSLPGGATYKVVVTATDNAGLFTPPSLIAVVVVPAGTNTNQIVLSNVVWPAMSGLVSYQVFASSSDELICYQQGGSLSAGANYTYTPNSITLNGPLYRSTYALPSPFVSKVRIKAKRLRYPGVDYGTVTAVSGNNVTVSGLYAGNTYTGRTLSVIGRGDNSAPFLNLHISGHTPSSGLMVITPQASNGNRLQSIMVGDVVAIRFAASGYTSNSLTDSQGTLSPGGEVGNLVRIIAGTGRGNPPVKITSNTATTVTWDVPLTVDSTTVWVIEEPAWSWSVDTTSIDNASPTSPVEFWMPITNFSKQFVLVSGFTVDIYGNESDDDVQPIREVWVFGSNSTKIITVQGNYTQQLSDITLYVSTANGPVTIQLLPDDQWLNDLFIMKTTADSNPVIVNAAAGWGINGASSLQIVQSGIPYVFSPTNQTAIALTTATGGSVGSGNVNTGGGVNPGNGVPNAPPPPPTLHTSSFPAGNTAALWNCTYNGTKTVEGYTCDWFLQQSSKAATTVLQGTSIKYAVPAGQRNFGNTTGISIFIGVQHHQTKHQLFYASMKLQDTSGREWMPSGVFAINTNTNNSGDYGQVFTFQSVPAGANGGFDPNLTSPGFDPTQIANIEFFFQPSPDIDGMYIGAPQAVYTYTG